MYHSQTVTTRRGALSKVWLAAHFDKKLTKGQIFSTDITASVHSLLKNENHLNLKVSGQLMLGIVKIYAKKLKYLMNDCTESMWKMKLALRPGQIDIEIMANNSHLIDDLRHFGNINSDFDFPMLDNIAFDSQYLLSTECFDPNSGDYNDDSYNTSILSGHTSLNRNSLSFADNNYIDDDDILPNFNDSFSPLPNKRYSDIEFARGVNISGRASLSVSHLNLSNNSPINEHIDIEKKQDNIKENENMAVFSALPEENLFNEANGFDDYYQQEFAVPEDKIEEEKKIDQEKEEEDENVEIEDSPKKRQKLLEEKVHIPIINENSVAVVTSRRNNALKIRRVVDENIELSENEYKKYLRNTSSLLRRKPTDKLPFENNQKINENQYNNQRSMNSLLNNDFQALFSFSFNHHQFSADLSSFSNLLLNNNVYPSKRLLQNNTKDNDEDLEVIRGSYNTEQDITNNRLSLLEINQKEIDGDIDNNQNIEDNVDYDAFDNDYNNASYLDDNVDLDGNQDYNNELDLTISSKLDEIFLSNNKEEENSKKNETINSKRTEETFKLINEEFSKSTSETKSITFKKICQTKDRRVAAQCFFELLQLKSNNQINLNQKYNEEIIISPVN